jgi:hypothetical protein
MTGYVPYPLLLQEVTPLILQLFASSSWWEDYTPSPAPLHAPYFTLLLVRAVSPGGTSNTGGGFRNKGFGNSRMGGCAASSSIHLLERVICTLFLCVYCVSILWLRCPVFLSLTHTCGGSTWTS